MGGGSDGLRRGSSVASGRSGPGGRAGDRRASSSACSSSSPSTSSSFLGLIQRASLRGGHGCPGGGSDHLDQRRGPANAPASRQGWPSRTTACPGNLTGPATARRSARRSGPHDDPGHRQPPAGPGLRVGHPHVGPDRGRPRGHRRPVPGRWLTWGWEAAAPHRRDPVGTRAGARSSRCSSVLAVVVIVLVIGGIDVTAAHLARMRLYDAADAIASTPPTPSTPRPSTTARWPRRSSSAPRRSASGPDRPGPARPSGQCHGVGATPTTGSPDGTTAVVSLRGTVELPIITPSSPRSAPRSRSPSSRGPARAAVSPARGSTVPHRSVGSGRTGGHPPACLAIQGVRTRERGNSDTARLARVSVRRQSTSPTSGT